MRLGASTSMAVWMMMLWAGQISAEPNIALRADGYVGYAKIEIDTGFGSADEDSLQGGGTGSVSLVFDGIYLQGDVFGDATEFNDVDVDRVGGGAHVGWRDSERGSAGIVGAINHIDIPGASNDEWRAGIEGQAFFDRVTVGLNAGFFDGEASSNFNGSELVYLEGSIALYPTDRARLHFRGGGLGIGKDDEAGIIGAGGELLVTDFVAAFFRWEASILDAGIDIDQHSVVGGLRIYWGADEPSLEKYDRAHFNRSCIGFQNLGRSC